MATTSFKRLAGIAAFSGAAALVLGGCGGKGTDAPAGPTATDQALSAEHKRVNYLFRARAEKSCPQPDTTHSTASGSIIIRAHDVRRDATIGVYLLSGETGTWDKPGPGDETLDDLQKQNISVLDTSSRGGTGYYEDLQTGISVMNNLYQHNITLIGHVAQPGESKNQPVMAFVNDPETKKKTLVINVVNMPDVNGRSYVSANAPRDAVKEFVAGVIKNDSYSRVLYRDGFEADPERQMKIRRLGVGESFKVLEQSEETRMTLKNPCP